MPAILARTRTMTNDMVNSVWAAMTDKYPSENFGGLTPFGPQSSQHWIEED